MTAKRELSGSGTSQRAVWILAAGCAAGLAMAASALISTREPPRNGLEPGSVAEVNGEPIRIAELERAVVGLVGDRAGSLDPVVRGPILERLIEEELLLQRALELGLARSDQRTRRELVSALIRSVISEAEASERSAGEVATFYRENRAYFSRSARLRARPIRINTSAAHGEAAALLRAQEVRALLRAGRPYTGVLAEYGNDAADVPDRLISAKKLRDYMGPTAVRTLSEMEPGEVSEPLRVPGGFLVVMLAERQAGWAPPLEEIEPEVRLELRRRTGEAALRRYIVDLRSRAEIRAAGLES